MSSRLRIELLNPFSPLTISRIDVFNPILNINPESVFVKKLQISVQQILSEQEYELREDGGLSLQEDGGTSLRE